MKKKTLYALLFITISFVVHSQNPPSFTVTSPNSNLVWVGASNKTIAWNTAETGTTAPYVDILLSTDGGVTFPEMLAEKVPNDGYETVLLPNVSGTENKIKIQSNSDDSFFDISDENFTISAAGPTMGLTYSGERVITICKGKQSQIEFSFLTFNDFNTDTWFSILDAPYYIDIYGPYPYQQLMNSDGTISITANVSQYAQPGIYPVTILAASGSITKTVTIYIEVPSNVLGYYYTLLSPTNNSVSVATNVNFQWQINSGIPEYYIIEIATDDDFNNIVDITTISQNSYVSSELLDDTTYFWRVTAYSGLCSLTSPTAAFLTGLPDCPIYNSEDIPVEIGPANMPTTTSNIVIPTAYSITDLSVNINITHTAINELTIKLKHPSGQEIELYQQNCEGQNIDVTFSNEGEAILCGKNPALTGLILPSESLTTFNNMSPLGIWTLSVIDNSTGNGGILNNWSLGICTTNIPLENEEYSLENLALYPNPNNGNFTIKFNSLINDNIKILIYDISGRQLLNKTYANSGAFEQQISLENAATGVYMVNVQDGQNIVSKKIVVK